LDQQEDLKIKIDDEEEGVWERKRIRIKHDCLGVLFESREEEKRDQR